MNSGKTGKLKTFGPIEFDYWNDSFNQQGRFGKLKSITGNSEKLLVQFRDFTIFQNGKVISY
ncbi:hypothetical protein [Frigoriflavimonas asaccharolytica]|uniref:Uncharacterized protein n=1 Tax=Frigoriflavimonas asaccharolytica TaxID=2735899 RepID=A0A8J8G8J4_9FLAO|nr:hypothetical protein [Frigoriflavimonas asaccharolytica]NRS93098.1 hypothetical protein [Frigoriflavimonas asaccharolytica]